jgi:hypothetical protein
LALLWIAAAAAQLLELDGLDRDRWLLTVAGGGAAIATATVHRLLTLRRVAQILGGGHPLTLGKLTEPAGGTPADEPAGTVLGTRDEVAGTPDDHSPDDRDPGFLDARPLRR